MRWYQFLWLLPIAACSLPPRPVSPTERYSQVSVTVTGNFSDTGNESYPLVVLRSQLTGEQALLRRQKAAVADSTHYSGRVPPGRYQVLGLATQPSSTARTVKFQPSLGSFDALAEKHCQLGYILLWRHKDSSVNRPIRSVNNKLCWKNDGNDKSRARRFAERKRNLKPPASLGDGVVLRHSGLLSYRADQNKSWQVIDSGSSAITAAVELSENELIIGGEHGLLIYYRNGEQQPLPLSPAESVVHALEKTPSGVAMLISTASSLQLLFSRDASRDPWQLIASSDYGFRSSDTSNIDLTVNKQRATATKPNGKVLLSATLP